ncbi:MAG: hypothetical protein Q7U77_04990, partial [Sediminibacterium sp.]|uniref:hypothetical protein n=1 Tax=Sediminibacterium sp. TaxID=1917865 RepID=UPI00271D3CE0
KYSTPNFLECIDRLAKGLQIHDENPDSEYITLSPGDLVYVPKEDESINQIDWKNKKGIADRTYIMRSSTETKCYFLPANIASLIIQYDSKTQKGEFESTNKSERTKDGNQLIKEHFIKLKVNRLGNITPSRKIPNETNNSNSILISEPETTYQKSHLRTFGTNEDMNEADAKEMASFSPAEHLQNATKLTRKLYAEELKKPMNKKLRFR